MIEKVGAAEREVLLSPGVEHDKAAIGIADLRVFGQGRSVDGSEDEASGSSSMNASATSAASSSRGA